MNMPPLPYLERIPGLDAKQLRPAFNCPEVWAGFDPDVVTLCSPDPQAFRLPDGGANVLHVGLPTNFKSAPFASEAHNTILRTLAEDIEAVRVDDKDVPVKLRVHDSLFVPFAKWSMLLTGNYRCVLDQGVRPIRDAVHGDPERSQAIYARVSDIVTRLGAAEDDLVPFEKYANAANGLLKPSSAARAVDGGSGEIERVDLLVSLIAEQLGMTTPDLQAVSDTVSRRLAANRRAAA